MTFKNSAVDINKINKNHENEILYFNCGGFAFNIYEWYCPYSDYADWYYYLEDHENGELSFDDANKFLTQVCVDYMLQDFNGLRVISQPEEMREDEYLIAFRISLYDDDFHFLRRSDEGIWYHKCGNRLIEPVEDFAWNDKSWDFEDSGLYYDGPIVLFAKTKY